VHESSYTVTGMTCDHCVNAVRAQVSSLPGVTKIDVDLTSGRVLVVSDAPVGDDAVRAVVDEAGYEVVS